MLGFVSHQVADITWHSLGIQQGFLQTMGKVNFWGSFPAAHNVGDPGGDMVTSLEGDTEQISDSVNNWQVKYDLLLIKMTEHVHNTCSLIPLSCQKMFSVSLDFNITTSIF